MKQSGYILSNFYYFKKEKDVRKEIVSDLKYFETKINVFQEIPRNFWFLYPIQILRLNLPRLSTLS